MKNDELYIEELLYNDAAKIVIDEEFKNNLKNKIMLGDNHNNITQFPKHKKNFMQNRYFKVASGFVICVFVSGAIFKTIDLPSKNIATEGNFILDRNASTTKGKAGEKQLFTTDNGANSKNGSSSSNKNNEKEQPKLGKTSNGKIIASNTLVKDIKKSNIIEKDTAIKANNNSMESDLDINKGLVNENENKNASALTDVKTPIDVPEMGKIKDDAGESLKCYDSRYSFDGKRLANIKPDGIYIKDLNSSKERKLIDCNEDTHIVEKPNFTPKDEIIYYKAEKEDLTKGAIYIADKNGETSTKIVDGRSPMVSKDGKQLVYEYENKIYIYNLETSMKMFVDNGKYPAWSDNSNLVSYVKEEKETQSYDESTEEKDVYIEKSFSTLWVFNLKTENRYSLTNKEVNIKNNSIESWADAVSRGNINTNFDVTSKYSYFESLWSSNNEEIYVIRRNNEAQVYELIKFTLDN